MIRPEKYLQLEQCTLNVAATILCEVRQILVLPLSQLEDLITSRLGDAALANLQGATNLLFLLGVLDYDDANDAFLFIEQAGREL